MNLPVKQVSVVQALESPSALAQVKKIIPNGMNPDTFIKIALLTIRNNPKLQACNLNSFKAAFLQSVSYGLDIDPLKGQAYLIPYKDECTFQIGYKGLIALAYRSGKCKSIDAYEVYKNDEFDFCYGLEPDLKHKPSLNPEGQPILYYAVYKGFDDSKHFKVWSRAKIDEHRKRFSKAFGKSPWDSDYDAMAKKTVLKDLLKTMPLSPEITEATSRDGAKLTIDKDDIVSNENSFDFPEMQEERKIVLPETAVSSSDVEPKKNLKDYKGEL